MRVALVTSWPGPCGIAEHSRLLMQHTPGVEFVYDAAWLDPATFAATSLDGVDLVHLNYHRGLHSRWTPEVVAPCMYPVVCTFHDTYEVQPDRLPWDLLACENVRAMVVHEPCDLVPNSVHPLAAMSQQEIAMPLPDRANRTKVHYWRQGVPEPQPAKDSRMFGSVKPVLGTVGFDFPWKNFDLLADATEKAGWNLLLVGPYKENRFADRPHVFRYNYPNTVEAVQCLASCDATAFLYTCGNSGTSGAIRLGLAAGRPLFWNPACRQFRDLADDLRGANHLDTIDVPALVEVLRTFQAERWDCRIVYLRERDSWAKLGAKYAALYREVAGG